METYGLDLRKKEGVIGSTVMISSDEEDDYPHKIRGGGFSPTHRFSNSSKPSATFSPIRNVQILKESKAKPP